MSLWVIGFSDEILPFAQRRQAGRVIGGGEFSGGRKRPGEEAGGSEKEKSDDVIH
jgi:hypothetical protein